MGIERRQWLLEVGWRDERRRLELDTAGVVVQMNADDLGRIARRQINRLGIWHQTPVAKPQPVAFRPHPFRRSLMQDAPPLIARAIQHRHSSLPLFFKLK